MSLVDGCVTAISASVNGLISVAPGEILKPWPVFRR
jgi:hypothetical protein